MREKILGAFLVGYLACLLGCAGNIKPPANPAACQASIVQAAIASVQPAIETNAACKGPTIDWLACVAALGNDVAALVKGSQDTNVACKAAP